MTIGVVIEQPCLERHRIPAFRALGERAGIEIVLHYGRCGEEAGVLPHGFQAELVDQRRLRIGGGEVLWTPSAWRSAGGGSDVLLLPWRSIDLQLLPAILRARRNGRATILWSDGRPASEPLWIRRMRERVAGLATALLFSSDRDRERFRSAGLAQEGLHLAPSALDQTPIRRARERWLPAAAQLAAFREGQGLDGPLILFVSRLVPESRLDLLLEAAAMLLPTHPRLALAIIGQGEAEAARLKARAAGLGMDRRLRLLGPLYDEEALAPWFLSADVFCHPSNAGPGLLHAFGFGLPVVTTDSRTRQGAEADALRPGENALLYGHGDAAALAGVLHRVIVDRELRAKLSRGALETAARRTLKAMVDGMERAIRYAAEKTGAQSNARAVPPASSRAAGD
jgi:glycosyltransferase involved in cell wall biosynthesis